MEFDTFERHVCPVCENEEGVTLFTTYDDRYGQSDLFTVVECKECGTCYLREAIVPEQVSALYEKYYGYSADGPAKPNSRVTFSSRFRYYLLRRSGIGVLYDRWFQAWTAQRELVWSIRKNDRVLEVGCGYGRFTRSVLARGAHWIGVEVDSKACQRVKSCGLECLCGTIETLDLPVRAFDVVIASQVIEHIVDPRAFTRRCAEILKPRGRLLVSTPNVASRYRRIHGRDWIHWFVPFHQVLFSPASLAYLGRVANFRIGRYWTETPTSWAILQIGYERPPRGKSRIWRGTLTLGNLQPDALSLRLRIEDALKGDGDCLVSELVKA